MLFGRLHWADASATTLHGDLKKLHLVDEYSAVEHSISPHQAPIQHSKRLSHLLPISPGRQSSVPSTSAGSLNLSENATGRSRPSLEFARFSPQLNLSAGTSSTFSMATRRLNPESQAAPFAMTSITQASPDLMEEPRASPGASNISHFDYDASMSGDETKINGIPHSGKERAQGKPRWLAHVKDWLSVSEPSAQAMKTQKRNIYQKHGIDINDPAAAAKLHFPMGQMPAGVTTSTKGPTPEKALKQRTRERGMGPSYVGYTHASHTRSMSSELSSAPSTKETNVVAPWDV